jgi:hypothetical protein
VVWLFLATDPEVPDSIPSAPDFLRSSGSGTGSTQPREGEELLEWKSSGSSSRKSRLTAVGIRCADHATPSIRRSWH